MKQESTLSMNNYSPSHQQVSQYINRHMIMTTGRHTGACETRPVQVWSECQFLASSETEAAAIIIPSSSTVMNSKMSDFMHSVGKHYQEILQCSWHCELTQNDNKLQNQMQPY